MELAFILLQEECESQIKNYDLEPIPYFLNGKEKKYYPDFIINNEIIVEVKGFFYKKEDEINKKRKALSKWCKDKNYVPSFVTRSSIPKRLIKRAKIIHNRKKKRNGKSKKNNKKEKANKTKKT